MEILFYGLAALVVALLVRDLFQGRKSKKQVNKNEHVIKYISEDIKPAGSSAGYSPHTKFKCSCGIEQGWYRLADTAVEQANNHLSMVNGDSEEVKALKKRIEVLETLRSDCYCKNS